jgi:hypothetical protein
LKILFSLFVSVWIISQAAAGAEAARKFSDEEWREDIRAYVENLKATHINLFHTVSEGDFNDAVKSLTDGVPEMDDFEIALELIAISAMIGDGHTWTWFSETFNPERLPFGLGELSDGVFIVETIPEFEDFVGRRIVSISGHPVESLLEKPYRFMSRDNEYTLLNARVHWLTNEAFLRYEEIVNPEGSIAIGIESKDGTIEVVDFDFTPRMGYFSAKKVSVERDTIPLYLQRTDETYWMEYLKKGKTLFVQINAVRDAEDGPRLGQFAREIVKTFEAKKAKKLVIDLRHNGGGNGDLTRTFVSAISRNDKINQPGRLFVITSPKTFSAALMFTVRLERATEALFAGVPGGGKPNSYGEFNAFTLPNSGLHGSVSSRWHEEGEPDDTREFVPMDIPVSLSSKDYFAGRDPVLDAILAYKN